MAVSNTEGTDRITEEKGSERTWGQLCKAEVEGLAKGAEEKWAEKLAGPRQALCWTLLGHKQDKAAKEHGFGHIKVDGIHTE